MLHCDWLKDMQNKNIYIALLCASEIEYRKEGFAFSERSLPHFFQHGSRITKKKDIVSYCEGSVSSEAAFFLKKDLMTWYGVKCQSCQMSN